MMFVGEVAARGLLPKYKKPRFRWSLRWQIWRDHNGVSLGDYIFEQRKLRRH